MMPRNQINKIKRKQSPKEWRPEWNDAISDLTVHKASPQELERRKFIAKSKHAETARRELGSKKSYSKKNPVENIEKKTKFIKDLLDESNKLLESFESCILIENPKPMTENSQRIQKYKSVPLITPAPEFSSEKHLSEEQCCDNTSKDLPFRTDSEQLTTGSALDFVEEFHDKSGNTQKLNVFNQLLNCLSKALTELEKGLDFQKSSSHDLLDEIRNSLPTDFNSGFVERLLAILCHLIDFIQKVTSTIENERCLRQELKKQIHYQGFLIDELTLELIYLRNNAIKMEISDPVKTRGKEVPYSSSSNTSLLQSSSTNIINGWVNTFSCLSCKKSQSSIKKSLSLPDMRLITAYCENQYFKSKRFSSGLVDIKSKDISRIMEDSSCPHSSDIGKCNVNVCATEAAEYGKECKNSTVNSTYLTALNCNQSHKSNHYCTADTSCDYVMSINDTSFTPWLPVPFQPAIMLAVPKQYDISELAPVVETNGVWFTSSFPFGDLQNNSHEELCRQENALLNSLANSLRTSSSLNENLELKEINNPNKALPTHSLTTENGKEEFRTCDFEEKDFDGLHLQQTSSVFTNDENNKENKQLNMDCLQSKLKALQNQYFTAQLQLHSLMTTAGSKNKDHYYRPIQKLSVA